MVAFRIVSTVLLGISCITCFFKSWALVSYGEQYSHPNFKHFIYILLWGLLWRSFVIVAIWVI